MEYIQLHRQEIHLFLVNLSETKKLQLHNSHSERIRFWWINMMNMFWPYHQTSNFSSIRLQLGGMHKILVDLNRKASGDVHQQFTRGLFGGGDTGIILLNTY